MRCRYCDLEFDEVCSTICPYCGKDNEEYMDDDDFDN